MAESYTMDKNLKKSLKKKYLAKQLAKKAVEKPCSLEELNKEFQFVYVYLPSLNKKELVEYNLLIKYQDKLNKRLNKRKHELYNIAINRGKSGNHGLAKELKEESILSKLIKKEKSNFDQPVKILQRVKEKLKWKTQKE